MIVGIWGEDKTGKTTLALSAPKPLIYQEFDIGGFNRANKNVNGITVKDDYEAGLIIRERYAMPFQIGSINMEQMTIKPSKIVSGMKELFYKWLARYIAGLDNEEIQTIVIDTATLLWEITCQGYLQEKQELQLDTNGKLKPNEKALRVNLQPPEYREPNTRMRGVMYQAQEREKHLILLHHATDEYGPILLKDGSVGEGKTGKRIRHGWAWLGDAADLVVHTTYQKEKKGNKEAGFYGDVELSGEPGLLDMSLQNPTYEKFQSLIDKMKG